MNKVATINLKGNEYALVPQRLKAFREANPRASVISTPTVTETGQIIFETVIVQDQKDPNSPRANGHSYGKASDGDKAFEKLETVSTGRALSKIGYLNNGQVASTEEMEEFELYQEEQFQKLLDSIKTASKREEFSDILSRMTAEQKQIATPLINLRIKELKDADNQ
jgi:hypothetical protein